MNDNEGEEWWMEETSLQRIRDNDPNITSLHCDENWIHYNNMTDENWEEIGRDISNNTHLDELYLYDALNDHRMSFLFRGLTRSSSIKDMDLCDNGLSIAAVRSMVPFLQNANNLQMINLCDNNLQSEGFNMLLRALHDSPIEELICQGCGIESIEIDSEHIPKHLEKLYLFHNSINDDGCREFAKLLQGGDATLTELSLGYNAIDDEGVEILVDALQNNKSLKSLYLQGNRISNQGKIMLLKLVNDVSSISATLQSNHTLLDLLLVSPLSEDDQIQMHIQMATAINRLPEAGRKKVIDTQLNSGNRAELAELQGVNQSIYSEINPLHLPEVLTLVGRHHGQGELYIALRSSIAGVISTVNRKQCLKQKIADHRNKIEEAEAEIATIEAAEAHVLNTVSESRSNKKRRF